MKSREKILNRVASLERKLRRMVNNPESNRLKDAERVQAQLAELYWVLKD